MCQKEYVLQIVALFKTFEVRKLGAKTIDVEKGDTIVLWAGPWIVYCIIVSRTLVAGTDILLRRYNWRLLMPSAGTADACADAYKTLGCTAHTNLVVWGVRPLRVNLFHFTERKTVDFTPQHTALVSSLTH